MVKHKANCSKQTEIEAAEEPLPYEMFCVCGFSSKDGTYYSYTTIILINKLI